MNSSPVIRIIHPAEFDAGDGTDTGFRASRGSVAATRCRHRALGWTVRGGTRRAHRNSASWRAADRRLCPVRHSRGPLGGKGRIFCKRKGWRLSACPGFPAAHGNQLLETGAISMGRRAQHGDAHRRQFSKRHLAVSLDVVPRQWDNNRP